LENKSAEIKINVERGATTSSKKSRLMQADGAKYVCQGSIEQGRSVRRSWSTSRLENKLAAIKIDAGRGAIRSQ
jgi:hypothetical protein